VKQRIRVAGIVQKDGEILVMKRASGRNESAPTWELPTGKIKFGEQPEEAMDRMLEEYLGIELTEKTELKDVITFVAPSGSSQLSNLYIIYTVVLSAQTKITPTERYTAYKYIKPEDLGNYHLDEASIVALEIEGREAGRANYREVANSATVYVDGASRGNPGPAGIGYVIVDENGNTLSAGGEFIGFATSRVSEYYSLKLGATKALELGLKSVRFVGDNLMMINQMKGLYKVKNQDLIPIYDSIQELLQNFDAYAFTHVKREQNTAADANANRAIDEHFSKN